jgi:hypothetical protein
MTVFETPNIANDPVNHRYTAVLGDLEPGTTYIYKVGDGSEKRWSQPQEFTTAPDSDQPFSFIYLGDVQTGFDEWGSMLRMVSRRHPEAKFYVVAGDIVDDGSFRGEWDSFFHNSARVFDKHPFLPSIGNHDVQNGSPWFYRNLLALPQNAPQGIEPERAYYLDFGSVLVISLDSNFDPEIQAPWLSEVLEQSEAKWKLATFHHPIYSSMPKRDNGKIRRSWTPIFDKYHVDMVLQGHDHAYLRTHPMKANKTVESSEEGTIYVISVSGSKMYPQANHKYTKVGFTGVPTYQVIDIDPTKNRLIYRSFDRKGRQRDKLVIEK